MPEKKKTEKKKPTKKTSSASGIKKPGKTKEKKSVKSTSKLKTTRVVKVKGKKPPASSDVIPIVGIGASAGGLEAIERFFSSMPSNSNIAFVIIQHLDPKHKSIMDTLITRHTEMKVLIINDGMKIEPNCIYLNPPNSSIEIINRKLVLTIPEETHGVRLPIDHFFKSLAEDQCNRSICIILSGTGTDGTLGLRAVKGEGGMIMAQKESQAKYDGMPRSAIETGLVDYILPVEKMPGELIKYLKHKYIDGWAKSEIPGEKIQNFLYKIFLRIRSVTGHDFSNYKKNTTRRRIERRMAVHQIDSIAEYLTYIQNNKQEVTTLFKDLLIGVTSFFRDPDAFLVLKKNILPEFLENRDPNVPIRVWVAGCSTGEEAYSLAILFDEIMEKQKNFYKVQIFATDLDDEAIDYARMGIYPDSIAADVSKQRLSRYFTSEGNTYEVKKKIRDMVVFAEQNLIKDPPFSRLDMVSCRNLMIYMDTILQKKILPLFHYTLNDRGVLFLGPSESIGEFTDFFSPLDSKWKIYSLKKIAQERTREYSMAPFMETISATVTEPETEKPSKDDIRNLAERIILDSYAPPCVIIDDQYNVLYFVGQTDRYLSPPVGEPSLNLLKMAREGLRHKLSSALHNATKQKRMIIIENLRVKQNGNYRLINLMVRPITNTPVTQGSMLVIFDDKTKITKTENEAGPIADAEEDSRITSLEQELQSTKEYLQTTIEELETSNEELKSTNEELQSVNEELQSTNEELETSKEELQSTNEELMTVNTELQNNVDELSSANNDINNLLSSTEIGTIFLDTNLKIKRYTPRMTNIMNLIPSDMGRPVGDITTKIDYTDLEADARRVLDTLASKDVEIKNDTGSFFSMRMAPYRTMDNVIDGVVITFVDITRIKHAEQEFQALQLIQENIFNTVREPLLTLNTKLQIISANRSFYKTFKTNEENTLGKFIYDLGNKQWDIPKLRNMLEKILPKKQYFDNFLVEHSFDDIGKRSMLLNARQVITESTGRKLILLAIEDVTDKEM